MASTSKQRQWAMESFLMRMDELKTVLGADVGPVLEKARSELMAGTAARDRGDVDDASVHLAKAMAEIAALGDRLGEEEGAMMRGLTAEFIKGMARADSEAMERTLDAIQARSGTPKERS